MTTSIYVNGLDFLHIIEGIEAEQFTQRGLTIQNGCYEGISFFIAFHNQNHFMCETLDDYKHPDQRYTLYDYKCSGVPGDHSLSCKITVGSQEVLWHDFKNFSRIIPFELDYHGLELRFNEEQYRGAIDLIRNNKAENLFA